MSKVVLRLVIDKAGFYDEGCEAIRPKIKDALEPEYGNLEEVTVSGDKATGWITVTGYHLDGESGKPDVEVADPPRRVEWRFRRLNGRWYNGE